MSELKWFVVLKITFHVYMSKNDLHKCFITTSRLPALRAGKPLDRVGGHSLREYQLQRTVAKVNEESIYTKNVGLGFETRNSFRFFLRVFQWEYYLVVCAL